MKTVIRTSIMWMLVSASCFLGFGSTPLQDLKQGMSNPNPSIRSSAMEEFTDKLATVDGETYMTEAVPIFISALKDPNVNVRRPGVRGLFMIAGVTAPVLRVRFGGQLPAGKPDLLKYEPLQRALLDAIADSDAVVRQVALATYAATYKLSPYLESKIIEEFNSPAPFPDESIGKSGLLESLMLNGAPSPVAIDFLSKLLDDPNFEWNIINRIGTDGCPLSPAVLAKFADMLFGGKGAGHEQDLVRAIGAYGAAAKSYLPQLEQMLASEQEEGLKLDLQSAIKQIGDAVKKATKPAPASAGAPPPSSNPATAPASTPTVKTQVQPSRRTISFWLWGVGIAVLAVIALFVRWKK